MRRPVRPEVRHLRSGVGVEAVTLLGTYLGFRGALQAASPRRLQAGISPALTFRAGASPAPVPGPRGGAGCSWEGGGWGRSLSDFVGQPWPRRTRPH